MILIFLAENRKSSWIENMTNSEEYMIKKILVLFVVLFFAGNCILFNTLGLNPGHVKGSEAKNIIQDRVMIHVLLDLMGASIFSSMATRAILDSMAAEFTNIDDNAYYKKVDVDQCANDIVVGGFVILAPWLMATFTCNLQPDDPLWDP